ncbi:MAG: hypothetical protein WDN24_15300 [Sphingomonas sp.]
MVAVFTGTGAGLERGSASVLGGAGLLGSAGLGRSGEQLLLNAANGNLLVSRQDEFLTGRGPDVGITRTYNSLGNFTDENGDNWRQSTDRRVFDLTGTANTGGSTVKRRSGDGSEITYRWNGLAYVATDGGGSYDTLTYNGSAWTWTDGDSRVTETYSAYGADWRITALSDTSGNGLTFTYSGADLTQVTTADGGYTQYTWSGGNVTSIVTSSHGAGLTRARYSYDGYNRLSTVTVDLSPDDSSIGDGNVYTTSYTYHGASKLIASISQTDGSYVSIGYDGSSRVASIVQTVSGGVTRTTAIAYGLGYTAITDPAGQVTTLYYDGNDQLIRITAPPAYSGAAQQTVHFNYDPGGNGDLVSTTDAASHTATYAYDGAGNLLASTDRLGNVVTRTYDVANQLLTETRVGSDKDWAAAWHTTRYVYDGASRLRYTVSAEGMVTSYLYDAYGQVWLTEQSPAHAYDLSGLASSTALAEWQLDGWRTANPDIASNQYTQQVLDVRGNLSLRLRYGTASGLADSSLADSVIHEPHIYDQAGQLRERTTTGLNTEYFVYDGLGRTISTIDLDGNTTSIAFNDAATQTVVTLGNGFVQTSTYNKAGDLVGFTESGSYVAGGAASYAYDQNGRLRVSTDATGFTYYYLYDKVGRKIADINQYGHITEYGYDANDRLVATVRYTNYLDAGQLALVADPNSGVELSSLRPADHIWDIRSWTVYDDEGRVIETIEGDGAVAAYEYDASSRLVRTTGYVNKLSGAQIDALKAAAPTSPVLPDANAGDAVSRIFYDKDGRTIGALDGEGYLTRAVYDAAGRKVQDIAYANATHAAWRAGEIFQNLIDSAGWAGSAQDRVTRYVYDGQGLLRYAIDTLGQVTEYGYETDVPWSVIGQVRTEVRYAAPLAPLGSYSHAAVKAAIALAGMTSDPANRTSWAVYNAAGHVAYSIDAGGGVVGYSYDSLGQVTKKVEYATFRATSTLPADWEMDSWAAANPSGSDRVTRYYYTARGEIRFTVDAAGYITRNDYDEEGRLTATYRWDTPVVALDWWTTATADASTGGTWVGNTFYYDAEGRLVHAVDGEGSYRDYGYDANGNLIWDVRMGGDGSESRILQVYDSAGRLSGRHEAWGTAEEASTYYIYDGLGNLTGVLDPNLHWTWNGYDKGGQLVWQGDAIGGGKSFLYNAFGETVRSTDENGNHSYSYYDKLGRVFASRDAEDYVTETNYTAFGEIASVTRRASKANNTASIAAPPTYAASGADATTTFAYDRRGTLIATLDADGNGERYMLDAWGQRIAVRNKLGAVTRYVYDRRGLLVEERLPISASDSSGATVSGVVDSTQFDAYYYGTFYTDLTAMLGDPAWLLWHWNNYGRYDGRNPNAGFDTNFYLAANPDVATAGDNPLDHYRANGAAENRQPSADLLGGTIVQGNVVNRYEYDARGNLVHQIEAEGLAEQRDTWFGYDKADRLTVRTDEMVTAGMTGAVTGRTETYAYDKRGNLIETTDATGARTLLYYDDQDRKVAGIDATGAASTYGYDDVGNLVWERHYDTLVGLPGTSGGAAPAFGGGYRENL